MPQHLALHPSLPLSGCSSPSHRRRGLRPLRSPVQRRRRVLFKAGQIPDERLDRAGRVLTSWRGRAITEAEQEAIMLRQAIADTDWETLERHGGFDTVVEKVIQSEQETGSPDDRGMIDDFRVSRSLRCRQMAFHPFDGGEEI